MGWRWPHGYPSARKGNIKCRHLGLCPGSEHIRRFSEALLELLFHLVYQLADCGPLFLGQLGQSLEQEGDATLSAEVAALQVLYSVAIGDSLELFQGLISQFQEFFFQGVSRAFAMSRTR